MHLCAHTDLSARSACSPRECPEAENPRADLTVSFSFSIIFYFCRYVVLILAGVLLVIGVAVFGYCRLSSTVSLPLQQGADFGLWWWFPLHARAV